MATKQKTVNYTDEQTAKVVQDYVAGVTVEAIAAAMGKTARSIVAKLSREGVYVKAAKVGKTGAAPVKKDEHASALATLVGLTEAEADSLTKANKTALAKIVAKLEQADAAMQQMVAQYAEALNELDALQPARESFEG
jgi:hypothetical protein